jgi:hypothetical protein
MRSCTAVTSYKVRAFRRGRHSRIASKSHRPSGLLFALGLIRPVNDRATRTMLTRRKNYGTASVGIAISTQALCHWNELAR